jgi:hypothetical protein
MNRLMRHNKSLLFAIIRGRPPNIMVRRNPPFAVIFRQHHEKTRAQCTIRSDVNAWRPRPAAEYTNVYIDDSDIRAKEAKLPNCHRQCGFLEYSPKNIFVPEIKFITANIEAAVDIRKGAVSLIVRTKGARVSAVPSVRQLPQKLLDFLLVDTWHFHPHRSLAPVA